MISIRRYQLLIILSVITLIGFSAAIKGYRSAMDQAQQVFDGQLQTLAQLLVSVEHKNTDHNNQQTINNVEEFSYQISHAGVMTLRSDNAAKEQLLVAQVGFADVNFNGQRWRAFKLQDSINNKAVVVAQPLSRRFDLAEQMILSAVTPFIVAIPIIAFLISIALKRSLRPLVQLSSKLQTKQADDFSSIHLNHMSLELLPVTLTLNKLFHRLESAFTREKRFTSDVAHELRTPLSVLKINTHNLKSEYIRSSAEKVDQDIVAMIDDLQDGVRRMVYVVEQILLLSRTNPEFFNRKFTAVSLKSVAAEAINTLYQQLAEKDQQIELVASNLSVQGEEFFLNVLLQNLLSNAIKYSPKHSHIRVSIITTDVGVQLNVEDSGEGIDETEFSRVQERFYRGKIEKLSPNIIGCGLGLSIVNQIAQLHQATLSLSKSKALGGLLASVTFAENCSTKSEFKADVAKKDSLKEKCSKGESDEAPA